MFKVTVRFVVIKCSSCSVRLKRETPIFVLTSLHSLEGQYRGADKSLARTWRKLANISVRMAWISFVALPCIKKNLITARFSMLLKLRASLTCFRACFLPGRAKDLSASRYLCQTRDTLRSNPVNTFFKILKLLPLPPLQSQFGSRPISSCTSPMQATCVVKPCQLTSPLIPTSGGSWSLYWYC